MRTKTLAVATGVILVCGAMSFGPRVGAKSEETASGFTCSDRTLKGEYGFSIEGTILAGTPNAFLLRGVSMTRFDGEGNLTQVDFTTRNGVPFNSDWRPAVGTYAINADCTGTAQIVQSDASPTVNLRLVIVDRGREIRTTVVGNASSSVGVKVH